MVKLFSRDAPPSRLLQMKWNGVGYYGWKLLEFFDFWYRILTYKPGLMLARITYPDEHFLDLHHFCRV